MDLATKTFEHVELDDSERISLVSESSSRTAANIEPAARLLLRLRSATEKREGIASAEEVWTGLIEGSWTCLLTLRTDGTQFLLARRLEVGARRRPLSPHARQVLERTARAELGKTIALDAARTTTASAVSQTVKNVLTRLGLKSRSELVLICRGRSTLEPAQSLRVVHLEHRGSAVAILVTSLHVLEFTAPITRAEREVAQLLVEGRTNEQIAAARNRSRNSVSNQVAGILKKLHVSTRYELIHRSLEWAPPAPTPTEVPEWILQRFAERLEDL